MDESSSSIEWPRRWHQIVAEYNASFESHQNRMRARFEKRFDLIRRDNDDQLRRLRKERDDCAERICDLIDEKTDVEELVGRLCVEKAELEKEVQTLDGRVKESSDLGEAMQTRFNAEKGASSEASRKQNEELKMLENQKRALRDEIRDLRGFVEMHEKLSEAGGEGSSILASVRGSMGRKK
jgi:chromosome segregation ATPase